MIEWSQQRKDVLLMWQDESWFSRFAQPNAHDWGGRYLFERPAKHNEKDKALACYGAIRADNQKMYLAFCSGQPNSDFTIEFIEYMLSEVEKMNTESGSTIKLLYFIWDHASWHKSKKLKTWIREHNRQAIHNGDARVAAWLLPKKSPWLNPIEPHWLHGKRAVCEPGEEQLLPEKLQHRLCSYYQTDFVILEGDYATHLC